MNRSDLLAELMMLKAGMIHWNSLSTVAVTRCVLASVQFRVAVTQPKLNRTPAPVTVKSVGQTVSSRH